MNIGKKIKDFRIVKGITQEALAQELGVTAQAVSRWENSAAMPDITLLPALSIYFGVRIDDFFELSDEAQQERIYNMTETEEFLPRADFDHAERFLKDKLALNPQDSESLTTLAALYNHRAEGYHRRAESLCKRALEVDPTEKAGHSLLSYAANGACFDWCSSSHRELIDYYYSFVEKNPDYRPGYMWLLDNLLADLRLEEALETIHTIDRIKHDYYPLLMEGYVRSLLGEPETAEVLFTETMEVEGENLYAWSLLGDIRVKRGGKALQIDLRGVCAHRLYKKLMTLLVGKANELVLDRGAVTGSCAVDLTRVERAARDVLANDAVRLGVGINNVTADLLKILEEVLAVQRGIGKNKFISGLLFENRKINALSLNASRGSGLEAKELDTDLLKGSRKTLGGKEAVGPRLVGDVTYKNGTFKIGSRGDNNAIAIPSLTQTGFYTRDKSCC